MFEVGENGFITIWALGFFFQASGCLIISAKFGIRFCLKLSFHIFFPLLLTKEISTNAN